MEIKDVPKVFEVRGNAGRTYKQFLDSNRYGTATIDTPLRKRVRVIQCDQTASSFPLKNVETALAKSVYPYYSNTHSNNFLGRMMSAMIDESKKIIMKDVHGSCATDKIIFTGSGSSGSFNHLVHMIKPKLKHSVVFVSVMEHYSNFLPWYHHAGTLVILDVDKDGLVDMTQYKKELKKYSKLKKNIIVSLSACSNVTGVIQKTDELARLCHLYKGQIFFDYAASAPYVVINMHKNDKRGIYYDAVCISPHKFPGGQSSPGVLIVNSKIVCNSLTFTPSGGTVRYFSKQTGPVYSTDMEVKQGGGTPNIIGIIRTGMAFKVKATYIKQIVPHELHLTKMFHKKLEAIQKKYPHFTIHNPPRNLHRLPIFSFRIAPYHYNFIVALLCDLFGIMTRGGISCSSILVEKILHLDKAECSKIKDTIVKGQGVPSEYGWIRLTLHSIHTPKDIDYIVKALVFICKNASKYSSLYRYDKEKNIFKSVKCSDGVCSAVSSKPHLK